MSCFPVFQNYICSFKFFLNISGVFSVEGPAKEFSVLWGADRAAQLLSLGKETVPRCWEWFSAANLRANTATPKRNKDHLVLFGLVCFGFYLLRFFLVCWGFLFGFILIFVSLACSSDGPEKAAHKENFSEGF